MSIWVADATPLIIFGKANLLDLIPQLTTELLVPLTVAREVKQGRRDDPARRAIERGFGTVIRRIKSAEAVREWEISTREKQQHFLFA